MRIIKATSEEIVIDGVVSIDTVKPKKDNGKEDSPDPIIRICHKAKKEIQQEYDACVAYAVSRPTTAGDPSETKIKFYFSNTDGEGKTKIPHKQKSALIEAEIRFCGLMSAKCADYIQEYLDS